MCVKQRPLTLTYMSMMTMSVFSIDASSWMKFLTTVVTVSNVIPPQIMICLKYKQNTRFCRLHTAFQSRIFLLKTVIRKQGMPPMQLHSLSGSYPQPLIICYISLRTSSNQWTQTKDWCCLNRRFVVNSKEFCYTQSLIDSAMCDLFNKMKSPNRPVFVSSPTTP